MSTADRKARQKDFVRRFNALTGRHSGGELWRDWVQLVACATHALQKGMPLELVSMMLGHNKLDTTKIYLSINEGDLKQAHRKYVT